MSSVVVAIAGVVVVVVGILSCKIAMLTLMRTAGWTSLLMTSEVCLRRWNVRLKCRVRGVRLLWLVWSSVGNRLGVLSGNRVRRLSMWRGVASLW